MKILHNFTLCAVGDLDHLSVSYGMVLKYLRWPYQNCPAIPMQSGPFGNVLMVI